MGTYEHLRDPVSFIVFLFTLALPVLVGVLAMRRTKSQSDFFLGGMGMNRVVVALSAVSSGRSSWLVLGVCGHGLRRGVSAVWAVVGYVVVEMLQFVFSADGCAAELRRPSRSPSSTTSRRAFGDSGD